MAALGKLPNWGTLVGIALAIPFAAAQRTDVIAISGIPGWLTQVLGGVLFMAFAAWMLKIGKKTSN